MVTTGVTLLETFSGPLIGDHDSWLVHSVGVELAPIGWPQSRLLYHPNTSIMFTSQQPFLCVLSRNIQARSTNGRSRTAGSN